MIKHLFFGALTAAVLVTGQALAHAQLESTVPADGETLNHAPQTLELDFSQKVVLTDVAISRGGEDVPLDREQKGAGSASFSLPLSDLEPGNYSITWRALSERDGHALKGALSFTVAPQ